MVLWLHLVDGSSYVLRLEFATPKQSADCTFLEREKEGESFNSCEGCWTVFENWCCFWCKTSHLKQKRTKQSPCTWVCTSLLFKMLSVLWAVVICFSSWLVEYWIYLSLYCSPLQSTVSLARPHWSTEPEFNHVMKDKSVNHHSWVVLPSHCFAPEAWLARRQRCKIGFIMQQGRKTVLLVWNQ